MSEQWTYWRPIAGLSPKYFVDDIVDTSESFSVVLSDTTDTSKQLQVTFDGPVYSYQRTDETFRHALICDLHKTYGEDFYGDWTFFKVVNSSYLRWLLSQSQEQGNLKSCIHYAFVASDSLLDVIHTSNPSVEFIESSSKSVAKENNV